MALALNVEPPAWLQDELKWARTISSEGTREFLENARGFQELKANNLRFQSGLLGLQQQEQNLEMQKLSIQERSKGLNDVDAWMKESGGDPLWMVNHPYTGSNPSAAQAIGSAQIRASQSLTVQKAKEDLVSFQNRLNALPPYERAAIGQMPMNPRTGLPSADQWSALSAAEEVEKQRRETERITAETEARIRGDSVTTTKITPKGVETTIKETPGTVGDSGLRTMQLPDGSLAVWRPDSKPIHVIRPDNSRMEMTPSQLQTLSDKLLDADPVDPTGMQIRDFLKQKAQKQVNPPAQSAPSQQDPLGLFR